MPQFFLLLFFFWGGNCRMLPSPKPSPLTESLCYATRNPPRIARPHQHPCLAYPPSQARRKEETEEEGKEGVTTSPTTATRTRPRPTPALAMLLRLGLGGGEERGGGRGFAEARAAAAAAAEEAAAAPAAGHDGVGGEERDRSSAGLTISFFPPSFFSFLFPSRNGGVCCRAGQLSRDTWRLTSRRSGWVARL